MTSLLQSDLKDDKNIQLGQASMNPQTFAWSEGTSTLKAAMPGKLKSSPLGTLKFGGTSLQAQVLLFHAGLTQLY